MLERNSQLADETTRQAAGQIGQLRSDPLMAEAVRYTLELYTGFAEETGHDPHIVRTGSLHLAHCVERMAAFQAQLDSAKTFGVDVQIADSNLISKIAPTVNQSEIVGALHVPGDGQTMPRARSSPLCDSAIRHLSAFGCIDLGVLAHHVNCIGAATEADSGRLSNCHRFHRPGAFHATKNGQSLSPNRLRERVDSHCPSFALSDQGLTVLRQ